MEKNDMRALCGYAITVLVIADLIEPCRLHEGNIVNRAMPVLARPALEVLLNLRCTILKSICFVVVFLLILAHVNAREKSNNDRIFEQRTGRDSQGYRGNPTQKDSSSRAKPAKKNGAAVPVDSNDNKTDATEMELSAADLEKIKLTKEAIDNKMKTEQAKLKDNSKASDKNVAAKESNAKNQARAEHESASSTSNAVENRADME
jgi:hypothetical protein